MMAFESLVNSKIVAAIQEVLNSETFQKLLYLFIQQFRHISGCFVNTKEIIKNTRVQENASQDFIEIIDIIKSPKLSESFSCLKHTDAKINFPLEKAFIVVTDIINSTSLYNENPLRMKQNIDVHDALARNLAKRFKGHIVANEGDSFHIVFENADNAVRFCYEFNSLLEQNSVFFKIRLGINKGIMEVRNYYGYKCYGRTVDDAVEMIKHNRGSKICIKEKLCIKYNIENNRMLCKH